MRSAAEVRTAAEASVRAALNVLAAYAPDAALPGVELLDERARLAGAGFAPRSAFRILPTAAGWLGLSLPRESDRELIPALIEGPVDASDEQACWAAVSTWLASRSASMAEARAILLGLPVARIPDDGQIRARRPPVLVAPGGERTRSNVLRVVDLSALWAGPLAARLLGLLGARVTKVESASRPDGARFGPLSFYERLHAGHEALVLDFATETDRLRELIADADVVIEASRPRALRQLGIHAEEFVGSGVVWVSITAYGRDGSNAMRVGFGDDVAAGAGLVAYTQTGPVPVGDAMADPLTGVAAAAAATMQLATGRGALIDTSMHDVCLHVAAK